MIAAFALAVTIANATQSNVSRDWTIRVVSPSKVEVRIAAHWDTPTGRHDHEDDETYPASEIPSRFHGVTMAQLMSADSPIHFEIVHPGGTIVCDGEARNGFATGTFVANLSSGYLAELQRRGVAAPTAEQQERLIWEDVDLVGLVDALREDGVGAPSIEELIRLANHGVSAAFIRSLNEAGIRGMSPMEIWRTADHGVNVRFLAGLRELGYHFSGEEIVRLADHGVTLDYVKHLRSLGYSNLSAEELIRLRDHGVN